MNRLFLIAPVFVFSASLGSKTLQENMTRTDNENFEVAASGFRSLIARDPTKGENYFYYAENFYKSGDPDSADIIYARGAEINATNPLNYIGLGKVLLYRGKADQ